MHKTATILASALLLGYMITEISVRFFPQNFMALLSMAVLAFVLHGFFIVSLITHFLKMGGFYYRDGKNPLNYGMDKARILRPVLVGDGVKLRDRISVLEVQDKGEGRRLVKTAHHIETDEADERPAAYVEYLNFWHPR